MPSYQNVVIIGGSIAGGSLANELVPHLPTSHRILLIDALDFAFWPVASLRASIVPEWEKRVTAPLTQDTVFPKDSVHRVIAPNKVVELRANSIVLERPFEGSTEIPFWKAVIATGAQQPHPMRPVPGSSEAEYRASLVKLQGEFQKAKSVVIVGGGASGLEVAGDIRERYPDTKITVVHSLSAPLNPTAKQPDLNAGHFSYSSPPTAMKLSNALTTQLKELNIDLITNDRVSIPSESSSGSSVWDGSFGLQNGLKTVRLDSGKTLQADFVFISTGNKPNISLVQSKDAGAITQGLIAVDKNLKVVSKSQNSIFTENYYAIGDCASSPGWKTAAAAQAEGAGASVNILAELRRKPTKPYTQPKPYAMFIPLGTKTGAGTLDLPLFGTILAPTFIVKSGKGKKLLVEELFATRFKGSRKVTFPAVE